MLYQRWWKVVLFFVMVMSLLFGHPSFLFFVYTEGFETDQVYISPSLEELIQQTPDSERILIILLEETSQIRMLQTQTEVPYSERSKNAKVTPYLEQAKLQLENYGELFSGGCKYEFKGEKGECTSPYLLYLNALMMKAPISNIAQIAKLPFVKAIWDGEKRVRPIPSPETLKMNTAPSANAYDWGELTQDNWGFSNISADKFQSEIEGQNSYSAVYISVIDTGFDKNHPLVNELNNLSDWEKWDFNILGKSWYITDFDDWHDQDGHGTADAGTIWQLVPHALFIIHEAPTFLYQVTESFDKAKQWNADIISTSISNDCSSPGPYDPNSELSQAANAAADSNTLVSAAAGNSGNGCDYPVEPSIASEVLSISSINSSNNMSGLASPTYSWGGKPNLAAPGWCIDTLYTTDQNSSGVASCIHGSSFATPHVAGAAGLLMELANLEYDSTRANKIKNALETAAINVSGTSLDGEGRILVDGAYAVLEGNDYYPNPNVSIFDVSVSSNNIQFRVSLQNSGDLSNEYKYNAGIHLYLENAEFKGINLGEFDEMLATDNQGNSVNINGAKIVELYLFNDDEATSGTITIDVLNEYYSSIINFRGWILDDRDRAYNQYSKKYDPYIARDPNESPRLEEGEIGTSSNPPFNRHSYDDSFTFKDYSTYSYTFDPPGELCSHNSDCSSGYCEGSSSHSARCCSSSPISDGWYEGGDAGVCTWNDPSSEYHDYYCDSSGNDQYEVTNSKDCDGSDDWYGGGNNSGCGNDPASKHRDYYVVSGTDYCNYEVCETKDCDNNDVCSNVCNGDEIASYRDYYVASDTDNCSYNYGSTVDNCATKSSDESDSGKDYFQGGYVRDYTTCSNASCESSTYNDTCQSGNVLKEHYSTNSSYSTENYDCDNSDGCSGSCPGCHYKDYYCQVNSYDYCEYNQKDPDQKQSYCSSCDQQWNIGGEVSSSTCCGDDSSENVITRDCDSNVCTSDSNDDACCNSTDDCVYDSTCYKSGYSGDVDGDTVDEECDAGVWKATLPAAPTNLTATAVSASQIDLQWDDKSDNEDGFNIYRDGSEVGSVGSNSESFSDKNLNSETQYCYEVTAYNTAGESGSSNEVCATTYPPDTAAIFRVTKEGNVYADLGYYCGPPPHSEVDPDPYAPPCFNSGAADIAESIQVTEPVEPGDIVALDPNHPGQYQKAREPYSTLASGVISTQPAFRLGISESEWENHMNNLTSFLNTSLRFENVSLTKFSNFFESNREPYELNEPNKPYKPTNSVVDLGPWTLDFGLELYLLNPNSQILDPKMTLDFELLSSLTLPSLEEVLFQENIEQTSTTEPLLALMGVVPVKATTENGPIRPGDLLTTSSIPGYAMVCKKKEKCAGAIIGKALESLKEGTGIIKMLVMR